MKRTRWLHVLVISIVAAFGALAIACGGNDDGKKDGNTPFDSPAIGVYYYEVGNAEYLLSLNKDKTLALAIGDAAILGTYDINASGALKFTVKNTEKLLDVAKYADDEVTLTYDGNIYKFLRRVDYTVTYNTGSGSKVESATVRNGKNATKPDDPTYDGHVFIGWYKDAAATAVYKFNTEVVRGDLTLYAGWVEKTNQDEYTVKLDLGYGDNSLYATKTTINGKVYLGETVDPERAGYTFKGWWTKEAESDEYAVRVDFGSYIFKQNETVYALWQGAPEGGKLAAPIVNVDVANNMLSWDSVEGAGSYSVKVVDPDGNEWKQSVQGTSVEYASKFTKAGTYTVEVYAVSLASADNNSAVTTRKIVSKQLARVSNFGVTGDVLTYGGVENATKYLLYIECGDENHDHNPVDNGNSKVYDFSDCTMTENGIKVVVEAQADGCVSSRSEEYVIDRKLEKVTGFTYDKDTQTISWSAVENATSYAVKVECDNPAHVVDTEVKSGTSINIGECTFGSVKVTVVAKNTKKYISADAAQYAVTKDEWAAVTSLAINNTTLSWKSQSQVEKYIVSVAGQTFDVTGKTNFDLADKFNWEVGKVYDIRVRAQLRSGELTSWSLPYSAAYKTMTELKYGDGVVSWTPVFGIGDASYKVVVNDASPVSVSANECKVKLTGKTNVIKVYIDGNNVSTAKSITVNAYKLTFNGNGGTDGVAGYYAKGDPIAFPTDADVTRRGYNLVGWYTAAEGTAAGYGNGDVYDLASDLTLYARWDGKVYNIKLNYNINGDNTDKVVNATVKFGSEYSLGVPTTPKSLIHGFLQWNLAANGNGVAVSDLHGDGTDVWNIADNNLTVYAVWAELFEFEKEGEGNNVYYVVRQGNGTPLVNEVVIPEQYKGDGDTNMYPVKVIGGNAFNQCGNLQKVTIPASIETIEDTAFNSCAALEQINVAGARPGIDKYWSVDGVLYGINNITEKTELKLYPRGRSGDFTLADGIEELSYHSLYHANINTLTLPSTFRRIGSEAFYFSEVTEVIFAEPKDANANAESLTIAGNSFNMSSKLKSITLPSREIVFGDGENIDFKADIFRGCSGLEEIKVATGNSKYTSIDGMLCEVDPATKEITLVFCPQAHQFGADGVYTTNNRLTAIGDKAFSGVSGLRTIEIDVSISRIGDNAFSGYTVEIDGTSRSVSGCSMLNKLTVFGGRATPLVIGAAAFGSSDSSRASALNTVEFQDGCNVTEIGDYAFAYCRIFRITFPDSLAKLGDGVFKDCRQLNSVTFGVSDEGGFTFGEDVFMNCTSLRKVVLPKNITHFEGGVFAGCNNLETIEVDPENEVLVFVDGILYGKENGKITAIHFVPVGVDLTDFVLPDGITEISAGVFGNAGGSIKKLTINKYVTNIGLAAFANTGLEEVIFENRDPNDPDDDGATTLSIAAPAASAAYMNGLFYSCRSLKKVTLPARLKDIPNGMFAYCTALESIDLTGVVTIGAYAFYNVGLKGELIIPASVETIGSQAFSGMSSGNKNLTKVTFEDNRTKELKLLNSDGTVDGLDANDKFTTKADSQTFYYCQGITEVHLPEKLVNLGTNMFYNASALKKINIPASVRSIRKNSFPSGSITNFTFDERQDSDALYLEDGNGATGGPGGGTSAAGVFMRIAVENLVLPKGLVRIPNYCFYNNTNLKTVTIPNTVRNTVNEKGKAVVFGIGSSAFYGCSNLTTITFDEDKPEDLANPDYPGLSIATSGLPSSAKFTSVELPARFADYYSTAAATTKTMAATNLSSTYLTSISVKSGCKDYSSKDGILYNAAGEVIRFCPRGKTGAVTIPYSVSRIDTSAFASCTKITSLSFAGKPAGENVADNDLVIGESAFSGCSSASFTTLTIPAHVTGIEKNGFQNCSKLTTLTFAPGSKLLSIGEQAFYGDTALKGKISIPASVTTIGVKAFSASNGLTLVTELEFARNGNLAEIGANAFEKIGVEEVYIPDSVTTLGNQVFANCLSLTTASLPLTVDNFNGMFLNCGKLSSLTFREVEGATAGSGLNKTDDGAVYSNDGSMLYYYPQTGVPNKGTKDEGVLTIRTGVTEISPTTFAFNPNIKKVIIPNTVTKIGTQAFYFMPALEEVEFEADNDTTKATTLVLEDLRTFAGCSRLTTVKFPERLQQISKEAFLYCTSLSNLTFAEGCKLTTINEGAFKYTGNLGDVKLPANLSSLGKEAFRYSGIKSVVIPATYKHNTSNTYAFADCANLTTVEFKTPATNRSSFQTVNYMFYNCPQLSSVTLPEDLVKIGTYTFQYDKSLTAITLPSNKGLLTTIDSSAFYGTKLVEITLPASLTTINSSAFEDCSTLVGVNRGESDPVGTANFPAKLNKIDSRAFLGCTGITNINLTTITSATSITLGASAFAATGITEMFIPKKVTSLNAIFSVPKTTSSAPTDVTSACANLTTIKFEGGNTGLKSIPAVAFAMLPKLKTVILPKGLTGSNKLTINQFAFYGTAVEEIEIPKETSTLIYSAFNGATKLKKITFEKADNGTCSLQWIGNNCFANTGLKSITIPASAAFKSNNTTFTTTVFDNCHDLETVVFESGSVITSFQAYPRTISTYCYQFRNCTALKNVTLPSNLNVVDAGLFYGCTALESITLPTNVVKIDNYAFNGCTKLKQIELNDNLDEIGDYAFQNCGLTSIKMPMSLTKIGEYAFNGCENLVTATYGEGSGLREIGKYAFNGCKKLSAINLPEGVTTIGNSAFESCAAITTVTLPTSLRTLGNNPFVNCDSLTEIVAPAYEQGDTVHFAVVGGALYGDKAVLNGQTVTLPQPAVLYTFFDRTATSFTVPDGIVGINNNAFWGMNDLTTLNANNDVSAWAQAGVTGLIIGESAFNFCGLTSVTLGENVTLMYSAFNHCTSLTSVTLPKGASLGNQVFDNCTSLTSITLGEGVTYGGYDVAIGADLTLTITGTTSGNDVVIANNDFKNDTSITKLVIAEGVTKIEDWAFYGCSNLTSVVFPSTLKSIGASSFRDCTKLSNVDFSACTQLEILGSLVFCNDKQLTTINLPHGLKKIDTNAFAATGLTTITIPNSVETFGATSGGSSNVFYWRTTSPVTEYICDNLETVIFEENNTVLKTLVGGSFSNLPKLKNVTLPDHLETFGNGSYAMFAGTLVTSVDIPDTVKTLGPQVFDGITNLTSINVLDGTKNGNSQLVTIGASVFRNTGLTGKITIPYTVTTIDATAFSGCSGITEVEFARKPAPAPEEGEDENAPATQATDNTPSISLTTLGKGAFKDCTGLTSITIPETVVTIGGSSGTSDEGVFVGCTNLAEVEFLYDGEGNNALRTLGYNTFNGTAITEMVVPSTVTKMYAAFVGCTQLKKLTLPCITDTGFGTGLVKGITSLEEVIIPEGVTAFYANSFEGCTGIKTLVIPSTLTTLWGEIFKGWDNTQTIYLSGIVAPRSGFELNWASGCNANLVWNYKPATEPSESEQP